MRRAFTRQAFCDWAGIGSSKFYDEIAAGRLRARKCGGRTLVLTEDAEAWAQALPTLILPRQKAA